ncbi:MAG TPA: riboflavin biosynthesis protein RibF, partial [Tepidisphaeraceae bacterium]|nr:riboflavin biosynthesis protein RibF [Tepidisphaeraceae bacterium]
HLGHARLLEMCGEYKKAGASAVAAVTFEPHPLTTLRPAEAPPRLTSPRHKQELIASLGADDYVVLPPSRDVLDLTAEAFWQILREEVRPAYLVEGKQFTFGKGAKGNVTRLADWVKESTVQLHVTEAVTVALLDLSLVPVSSSLVRWLLAHGRVRDAAICLGRPYRLNGTVIEGARRGRTIGVPTANLRLEGQMIPGDGVYAGRCAVDGKTYAAAINLGPLPTFDENARQVEAHLIGFSGDLYGRMLELDLLDWLRDQRKFAGIDALKAQLDRDIQTAHQRQAMDAARPIAAASL